MLKRTVKICDSRIIATIGGIIRFVYKREIGKLLYSHYSICKLSWNAVFSFCVLIISQKKTRVVVW